jgi:hypothetical protein
MKHQPSTVDLGITDMRLEGCTLDLAGLIRPFNNHIRFLESLLYITDLPWAALAMLRLISLCRGN